MVRHPKEREGEVVRGGGLLQMSGRSAPALAGAVLAADPRRMAMATVTSTATTAFPAGLWVARRLRRAQLL